MMGKHHREEGAQRRAAVDERGLLDFDGNRFHEAAEHEDRKARSKAQIDDDDSPRGVEVQAVGHKREGKHDHLEGHDHGEHAQQIHELALEAGCSRG